MFTVISIYNNVIFIVRIIKCSFNCRNGDNMKTMLFTYNYYHIKCIIYILVASFSASRNFFRSSVTVFTLVFFGNPLNLTPYFQLSNLFGDMISVSIRSTICLKQCNIYSSIYCLLSWTVNLPIRSIQLLQLFFLERSSPKN